MNNLKPTISLRILTAVIAGGLVTAQYATAASEPPISASVGGQRYEISSVYTSFNSSAALLTSTSWWGNQSLATSLAAIVGLGGTGGQLNFYPASTGSYGSYFAYGCDNCAQLAGLPAGSVVPSGVIVYSQAFRRYVGTVTSPDFDGNEFGYFAVDQSLIAQQAMATLASISSSLQSTASGVNAVTTNINMLINGAHSRPLSRLVETDKNTFWVAGDWGRDDHGNREGRNGLAEFGVGRNFGMAQLNASFGQTWATQSFHEGGKMDSSGQYVMLEAIIPIVEQKGIYTTLGGFNHWGKIDNHRGYLAMDKIDSSKLNHDTNIWGINARLDWINALSLGNTILSPYTQLSYTNTHVKGGTEKGGAIRARFDSKTDAYTEARVGLNTETPLPFTKFNFISNIEGAHRFSDRGIGAQGEVVSVTDFDLKGDRVQRNWIKAGAGIEGLLGPGKATFTLNGTSNSDMPNLWLAAAYQLSF